MTNMPPTMRPRFHVYCIHTTHTASTRPLTKSHPPTSNHHTQHTLILVTAVHHPIIARPPPPPRRPPLIGYEKLSRPHISICTYIPIAYTSHRHITSLIWTPSSFLSPSLSVAGFRICVCVWFSVFAASVVSQGSRLVFCHPASGSTLRSACIPSHPILSQS
ncbi:hypothetical protein L226DRAFT_136495 [Lentinus tigrinus ALCF2SS1-7]|uniref:Uncharacterized protein n=1 Tax=Lentinus tigrinus ALCF2SS1-6 TaxID=1328759 RepID=A0A5C2SVL6_9APHY|nr:hypothetical protein L227DRAFT_24545 [Lentinus tigrinus ALCF2SS1-6]RPD81382.1 hypothetical protein L226DRAFT_136495 [Lentinus tigrinus ALCF2SS1-7]